MNRFKDYRRKRVPFAESFSKPPPDEATPKLRQPPKDRSPGDTFQSPVVPDGEDELSFSRHNKAIKSEMGKKGRANKTILTDLINQSFAMRRRDILESTAHCSIIVKKYPFLKEPIQV